MRHIVLPLALLALAAPLLQAPAGAAAPARAVASAISAVTVYPDRAAISREARVVLAAGRQRLRLANLPYDLDPATLRVSGAGAPATIRGFDVETAWLGASPEAAVRQLEARAQALADRQRALADEQALHERQLDVLVKAASETGAGLAKQVAAGKADLGTWQRLLDFLEARQRTEARALQALLPRARQLEAERKAIEAERAKLRGARRERVRHLEVDLESPAGGAFTLGASYVMPRAGWTPAHDARLSADGKALAWTAYGVVTQQTGEAWNDVALTLSTARPAEGAHPPDLPSWFLSTYVPRPAPAMRADNRRLAPMAEAEDAAAAPAPEAVAIDQGVSVTLAVPGAVTVPADGAPHQAPLGSWSLAPATRYRAIPRETPLAFLEVSATAPARIPLLPGPVQGYVGRDFVGQVPLASDVSPGQRFSLALGVDRAIGIARRRLEKQAGEAGLFGKAAVTRYRYEVTVANHKAAPQTVTVLEPLPRSTDARVTVRVTEASLPPDASEPGSLTWEIPLKPHEARTLRWGYEVSAPPELPVTGLE